MLLEFLKSSLKYNFGKYKFDFRNLEKAKFESLNSKEFFKYIKKIEFLKLKKYIFDFFYKLKKMKF